MLKSSVALSELNIYIPQHLYCNITQPMFIFHIGCGSIWTCLKFAGEVKTYRESSEGEVSCEMCIHTSIKWCWMKYYVDHASLIKVQNNTIPFWILAQNKKKRGRIDEVKENDG